MNDIISIIQQKMEEGLLGDDYDRDAKEEATENSDHIEENVNVNELLQSNIVTTNNGSNIKSIIDDLESGFNVIPPFQRRFVWNRTKIAYLALSIIQSVPIPPIYLYTNEDLQHVVLDGQQRMIAIYLYFSDLEYIRSDNHIKFAEVSKLNEKLRAIEKEESQAQEKGEPLKEIRREKKKVERELLNYGMKRCSYTVKDETQKEIDISFKLFSEKNQDYLKQKHIDITILESRDMNCIPHKTFANIFKLLNSGGKYLGPQEVRNGVYWDTSLYKNLYELNENNSTWRTIYGNISDFSKDMEILLKILSLNYYVERNDKNEYYISYSSFSWAKIMDAYSEKACEKNFDVESEIQRLKEYLNAIKIDKKDKCQRAVFEAVFVAYCKLEVECEFKISYEWLCKKKFETVASNKSSVEHRINTAITWLREIYDDNN